MKVAGPRPRSKARQGCVEIAAANELITLWKLSYIVIQFGPQVGPQFAGLGGLVVYMLIDRQDVNGPLCLMQTYVQ